MIVLLAGSRQMPDPSIITDALWNLIMITAEPIVIRHGACPGILSADQIASEWIYSFQDGRNITEDAHPADWDKCMPWCSLTHRRTKTPNDIVHPGKLRTYCPAAGPRRNLHMVALGANLMLAAPIDESYGTRNCMKLARAAGIRIVNIVETAGRVVS